MLQFSALSTCLYYETTEFDSVIKQRVLSNQSADFVAVHIALFDLAVAAPTVADDATR